MDATRLSDERLAQTIFGWEVLDSPEDPAWHGLTATQRDAWTRRARGVQEMYPEVVGLIERAEQAEAALARVTDDSMADRIEHVLSDQMDEQDDWCICRYADGVERAGRRALDAIRAAATAH